MLLSEREYLAILKEWPFHFGMEDILTGPWEGVCRIQAHHP